MPRISELPATSDPNLNFEIPTSHGGGSYRLTLDQVRALMMFAAGEITYFDTTVQNALQTLKAEQSDYYAKAELTDAVLREIFGKIANGDLADVPTNTLKMRLAAGAGPTQDTTLAQLIAAISANVTLGGYKNKVRNPSATFNQRRIFTWANGVYGADCWRGHANGREQFIERVDARAGTWTLSWAGGGQGRIAGGALAVSPITATIPGTGNVSIVVPAGATDVQFERSPVATAFEERPDYLDMILCMQRWQKTFPYNTVPGPNQGFDGCVIANSVGVNICGTWQFSVPMRPGVSLTIYNPANDATPGFRNLGNTATVPVTVHSITERGVNVISSAAASNQFHGIHFVASADLTS